MTDENVNDTELAYAQARAYGKDVARLYAAEKARRQQLETTTQKLQAIFDTAPNGLAVVDNTLIITEANPRFLDLFQLTNGCIGQPLIDFMPVESLLEAMETIKNDSTGMGAVEIEIAEPVVRTLLVNIAPLSKDQGWVLIFHDLTERKRLENLKDEFVNIAAHELRTPLAGVMGFVGVLQEELRQLDDPMVNKLTDLILHSTERLRVTIDELVDFATAQRSTYHSLHIADIDLGQLLQKSVDLLRPQMKAKNITCRLDLPMDLVVVQGDRFILGEVIHQILSNAITFNKPDGQIIIRAEPGVVWEETGETVTVVEIEDTGIGIPRTDLEKVFDKFYQVEEHLTRGIGGLGLGLTIARRGVEQHRGQLTVTSELGQGSTFRIVLPPITELNEVSIDNRLDVAHQQMLTFARDMARAVALQRRMGKQLARIQTLSADLESVLNSLLSAEPKSKSYVVDALHQAKTIIREMVKLSARQSA